MSIRAFSIMMRKNALEQGPDRLVTGLRRELFKKFGDEFIRGLSKSDQRSWARREWLDRLAANLAMKQFSPNEGPSALVDRVLRKELERDPRILDTHNQIGRQISSRKIAQILRESAHKVDSRVHFL